MKNQNCEGENCKFEHGTVKLYPANNGNMILCRACWDHENAFRWKQGRATKEPHNWPIIKWATAKIYDPYEEGRNDEG